jgi:hypothetical protein
MGKALRSLVLETGGVAWLQFAREGGAANEQMSHRSTRQSRADSMRWWGMKRKTVFVKRQM